MTTIRYDRIPTLKIQLSGQENFSSWSAIVKSDFRLFKVLTIALGQDTQPLPHIKSEFLPKKGKKTEVPSDDASETEVLERIGDIQDSLYDKQEHDENEENLVAEAEAEIESWVERNQWGCSYLYHNVEPEIVPIIAPYENLSDMWKAILDTYDRRTPTTLLNLVKTINRLEYDDTSPLKTHIQTFEQLWMQLTERTSLIKVGDKLAEIYGMMASSYPLKAQYLLMSLPSSYDSIVDNLQTKAKLTYQDVYEHLMNIATKQTSSKVDKTAYTVKTGGQPPKKIEGRYCTFCTKRNNGVPVTSHDHRRCFKLKKAKQERTKQGENKEANVVQATCFYMSYLDPILDNNDKSVVPYPEYKTTLNTALVSTTETTSTSTKWIFDTGATDHISGNRSLFTSLSPLSGNVTTAGGSTLPILGTGSVEIVAKLPDGTFSKLCLENVLYVSGSHFNLLSWKRISAKGFSMSGSQKEIRIQKDGKVFAWAQQDTIGNFILAQHFSVAATAISFRQWHQRLGHLPSSSLSLLKDSVADPECLPKTASLETCVNCQLGKSTALPYSSSSSRTKGILELVHSDLSGKFTQASLGGMHYYISFIDDFSRMSFVYFLKNKSDAHEALRVFVTMIETQTGKKVKRLRTDNGGEYINKSTSNFLTDKGIIHETTAPYAHSSNGIAERFNRTIATMARTVVLDKGKFLWAEAIAAMCYTKNRIPHKFVQKTPFEAFFGQKPKISHLKTFGEKCFVHIDVEVRGNDSKFSARAKEGIFVGYTGANNVYRIYIPSEKKVAAYRNVRFPELSIPEDIEIGTTQITSKAIDTSTTSSFVPKSSSVLSDESMSTSSQLSSSDSNKTVTDKNSLYPSLPPSTGNSPPFSRPHSPNPDGSVTPPGPRRSTRDRKQPDWYTPFHSALMAEVTQDPITYKQAMESEKASEWKLAMKEEMDSIEENGTWELVDKPEHRKVVACKWVYKTKLGAKGELVKNKARLVAKGFSQVPGQDYDDTFAPVSRYESLRLLLATAHSAGWEISQMDVKSAFLNGNLKEEIYMTPPPGMNVPPGKVCKLRKCIYGLKQASREWYLRLSDFLITNGFSVSTFDPCVFVSADMILDVYVDDITMFARQSKATSQTKALLKSEFKMTDLGKASWILGIAISYVDGKLRLDQTAYIDKVLERFNMTDCRPVSTPFDTNVSLQKGTENEIENQTLYQSIVGSLMYAAIGTRPDLAYAVTTLSQFSSAPNRFHMNAAKRTLRYLKETRTLALYYEKGKLDTLKGYSDSSYACCPDTRRSITGNCFFLGNNLISWSSRKQTTVALSTTEAEYMALSHAARQMVWLRRASEGIGLKLSYVLFGDNNGALLLSKNPVHHKRSKHIDVQFHYVRERLFEKVFSLEYVSTGENVADVFTKSLDKTKHFYFCSLLHCDS